MEENIYKASKLSAWLIKEKGRDRRTAIIIGCRKFKVLFSQRSQVGKEVTKLIKEWGGKQESLL
ncbi:MAG TPA: hypothetical protein ENI23_12055 [bacterium]|nr:hypothetical protein [bacterium]